MCRCIGVDLHVRDEWWPASRYKPTGFCLYIPNIMTWGPYSLYNEIFKIVLHVIGIYTNIVHIWILDTLNNAYYTNYITTW